MQQMLRVRQTLFTAKRDWEELVRKWNGEPLASLDVVHLQRDVNGFVHTVDYLEQGTCKVYFSSFPHSTVVIRCVHREDGACSISSYVSFIALQ